MVPYLGSPMKVLIIGGTGLISSGIVKALKTRNAKITVFNRGTTDDRLGDGIEHLHGDRNNFPAFESAMAAHTWDAVIDMISYNPEQAESAVRAFAGRTAHFIFCSTVCTYGNTQTIIPTTEGTPQTPHSSYGKNKVACEKIHLRAHDEKKFAVTIIRPSHTYGPGGGVINNLGWSPTFVDRLRKGKPIIVSGDGHGLWASAYSDDVGVGFAYAVGNKKCFGEAYNAVSDECVTWDQYTQRTAAAIGAPAPRIVHIPTDFLLALDPKRYNALDEIFQYHGIYSNCKLKRDVPEFRITTSYADGVRKTVAWMDQHKKVVPAESDLFEDGLIELWERFTRDTKKTLSPAV